MTTPTGIPVTKCDTCGREHPVTRRHCQVCGVPSIFIGSDGCCLWHTGQEACALDAWLRGDAA